MYSYTTNPPNQALKLAEEAGEGASRVRALHGELSGALEFGQSELY